MKYLKEFIILILQLGLFYISPLFAGPTDMMGLAVLLIIGSFFLGFILGIISKFKIKFLYPIFVAILFIPSVFILYNYSALHQTIWYCIGSFIGLVLGSLILFAFQKIKEKIKK